MIFMQQPNKDNAESIRFLPVQQYGNILSTCYSMISCCTRISKARFARMILCDPIAVPTSPANHTKIHIEQFK
ncbi:hypothetical protein EVA_09405 [gut metagenome]|uniref:Uncharacterized protein n=1 Tax=gut metagenome TaxID=749906 RepID=J9GK71_9ZZZZ